MLHALPCPYNFSPLYPFSCIWRRVQVRKASPLRNFLQLSIILSLFSRNIILTTNNYCTWFDILTSLTMKRTSFPYSPVGVHRRDSLAYV
jgi:hypothetical protein